ncbi:MAG TPA: hypoxanthine phosphoribosyltransferase [Candidatus Aphodoplasma excrementigallinarum]|uniref:Hypoxanthine phosphoribosyltransferase n=1 Tax=Candidatus Aphodoplasma excrementigallinarum TaxID=2840673 RepID=A0A9D1NH18_9FIRM|nr:hypoxanthine phosphoribosyltransferase [Candidatus Aphodoplasma excrementigallinarum]
MKIHEDVERVLISAEELDAKVSELAEQISRDYAGKTVLVVTLLKGGVMFAVDLMRKLTVPVEIDFMSVSSYGASSKSSGIVTVEKDLDNSIKGKDVLLVEDIIDSGLTLNYVRELLLGREPASLRICTILDKPSRRKTEVKVDYTGFEIPDEFVVGYGLDYAQKHRNLPYVGVLKRSVYENE